MKKMSAWRWLSRKAAKIMAKKKMSMQNWHP